MVSSVSNAPGSNIAGGIAESLVIQNKIEKRRGAGTLPFLDGIKNLSDDDRNKEIHQKFMEYYSRDEALESLQKITHGGLEGYVAAKIDALKASLTKRIMEEKGITLEGLNKMNSSERASLEQDIMQEVARRLKDILEQGTRNPSDRFSESYDASNDKDPVSRKLSGRLAPLPPLMPMQDAEFDMLEETLTSDLQDLYGDYGFFPYPPIDFAIDDRGKIKLSGDRNDIAEIQAAIAETPELTRKLQAYGAAVSNAAMLAPGEDPSETPPSSAHASGARSSVTERDSASDYQRWIANRTPRESFMRFTGIQIEAIGSRKIS